MELAQNISRHSADGGIARNFSKLVPTHPVCNDVEAKRKIPGISRHGCCHRQQAIFIQFTLLANRLSTTGNELLEIEARILIADNGLYLLFREGGSVCNVLCRSWCLFIAS